MTQLMTQLLNKLNPDGWCRMARIMGCLASKASSQSRARVVCMFRVHVSCVSLSCWHVLGSWGRLLHGMQRWPRVTLWRQAVLRAASGLRAPNDTHC